MAIFASTTTSGYSDPMKAYSIKALEMRQQEMQAQQAKAEAAMFTPENTQTPIQGLGQVANVFADKLNQSRLDSTAAANRNELSSLIAGSKPGEELSPQAQGRIAILAPDMYKEMLTQTAERRRQEALFKQQDAARAADAEIAQKAAVAQEERVQARPTNLDVVQADRALARGEIDKATRDAIVKKATGASPSEAKYVTGLQEQSVAGQSLLSSLDEALNLTNHPKGIHAGGGAGMVQGIGENTPKILQGVTSAAGIDPETTSNTQRFNQIMGEQALTLLNQMKGASSDRDVQVNFKIANDPSATIDNKRKAIIALQTKLRGLLQVHNDSITEAGGKIPTLQKAGGGADATTSGGGGEDPNAAAKAWLAANPNDPRAEAVRKKLGGG